MEYKTQIKHFIELLIICAAAISIANGELEKSSSSLKSCKLHDPENSECLTNQWQQILISGINDVPGFKWISVDPYTAKRITLDVHSPALNVTAEFKKVVVTGLKNATIENVSIDNGETFILDMKVPKLHFKGNYIIKGTILLLKLDGKGPFTVDYVDLQVRFVINSKLVSKDSEQFFDIKSVKTDVKHIGLVHVKFDNVFGDNQSLTDSANDLFNQNWSSFLEILRPILIEGTEGILVEQGNKYISKLPARILFSDL
ncbi:uncharacterized protein [Musca autumnalis]|uniref:uncharacterized protein n=1 Tax=Musca autumnalis TaxID=221902 RepID=UPI003CF5266C